MGLTKIVGVASIALLCVATFSIPVDAVAEGRQFYAAPLGTPLGDGSITAPWDLATALKKTAVIAAGDTLNLRGGRYVGKFEVTLRGSLSASITVRSYPNEWAVIDSGANALNRTNIIQVRPEAGYLTFRDFEIMSSYPVRKTLIDGSYPDDIKQGEGITVHAPAVKIINLFVHDANLGISAWQDAPDTEIYGNLVYHNGWQGPKEGGSGHGLYVQNASGVKLIHDNIVTSQFGKGIHPYTSLANNMKNISIEGNTIFFNGSLSTYPKGTDHIHVGGGGTPENLLIRNNYMYSDPVNTGLVTLSGERAYDVTFDGNILPNTMVRISDWARATITNNVFNKDTSMIELYRSAEAGTLGITWDRNTYFSQELKYTPFAYYKKLADGTTQGTGYGFSGWKTATGFDAGSTYAKAAPSGVRTIVRPNKYESGRANITVYNFDNLPTVSVDISGIGLVSGDTYELHNAQDYFGDVIKGTYSGVPLSVPMTGHSVARPIGDWTVVPPSSFPVFGAFIIKKSASAPAAPVPQPAPVLEPVVEAPVSVLEPAPVATSTEPVPAPAPEPVPTEPAPTPVKTPPGQNKKKGGSGSSSWKGSSAAVITTATTYSTSTTTVERSLSTASAATTTPTTAAVPSLFKRTLAWGMRSEEVRSLQRFLNSLGFTVSTLGAGSTGKETTYFGPATYRAVVRFQEAYRSSILVPNNLKRGTGYFGPASVYTANKLLQSE